MDPTVCLNRMMDALQDGDHADAYSAAHDLLEWMEGGGSPPNFSTFTIEQTCDLAAIVCFGVMAGCKVAQRIEDR